MISNAAGIEVWQANLDLSAQSADRLFSLLDSAERTRALRFARAPLRRRFIGAHAFARQVIGHYLGISPESVHYDYTPQGKPYVRNDCEIRFNLSHSGDLAALAIAERRELGIDIEHIHHLSDMLGLAYRYFSQAEIAWLAAMPAEKRSEGFFTCWTAKEAYVKARGDGLSFPLDRFHVLPIEGSSQLRLEVAGEPAESHRWWMTRLSISPTTLGALAVEQPTGPLRIREWINL